MKNKNLLVGIILVSIIILGLFIFIFDGAGITAKKIRKLPEKLTEVQEITNEATPTILDELPVEDSTPKVAEPSTIIEESENTKHQEENPMYIGFALQLGIFSNVENAEKFKSSVEKLTSLEGRSVIINKTGTANKVLAVDFKTYEEAKEVKTTLDTELKIKSIIIDLGK